MGRLLMGIVIGGILALGGMVPAAYKFRQLQRERGRVEGKWDAMLALEDKFGIYKDTDTQAWERVFSVKCADVLAITVDNVKTVRTTRPGDDAIMKMKDDAAKTQAAQ